MSNNDSQAEVTEATEAPEVETTVQVSEFRVQPLTKKQESSVETFISQAIKAGVPIETLERLLALRKEARAEQAHEAFTYAMAKFQAECPVIAKTKEVKNKDGKVTYRYAPLDTIILQTKGALGSNQLAYDFTEVRDEKTITVTCTITHSMGHTKSSAFTVDIGSESFMTDTQKYGARNTFAKRYAFMNVLGIATGDEDTDAREITTKTPKLPADPKAKIVALMRALGYPETAFMKERVTEFTQLDPNNVANVDEIISRLTLMLQEKNENS